MKTPYDAACRLGKHELDAARGALARAEAKAKDLALQLSAADARMRQERRFAADNPLADASHWIAVEQARIGRLTRELGGIEVEIDGLRNDLMARFAALMPLDHAADDWRQAERTGAMKRQQRWFDDVAAQRA